MIDAAPRLRDESTASEALGRLKLLEHRLDALTENKLKWESEQLVSNLVKQHAKEIATVVGVGNVLALIALVFILPGRAADMAKEQIIASTGMVIDSMVSSVTDGVKESQGQLATTARTLATIEAEGKTLQEQSKTLKETVGDLQKLNKDDIANRAKELLNAFDGIKDAKKTEQLAKALAIYKTQRWAYVGVENSEPKFHGKSGFSSVKKAGEGSTYILKFNEPLDDYAVGVTCEDHGYVAFVRKRDRDSVTIRTTGQVVQSPDDTHLRAKDVAFSVIVVGTKSLEVDSATESEDSKN
jgi:hypothetical protein